MAKTALALAAFALAVATVMCNPPNCDEVGEGNHPNPVNCRKYYRCEGDALFDLICQEDWLYSVAARYCDFPVNVDCGDIPLCDDNDQNCEEHHTTTYAPLVPCDIECPEDNGYFETEACSSTFCSCTNGIGYEQECEDGLVFNPELGGCDWPYNNPDCAEFTTVGAK